MKSNIMTIVKKEFARFFGDKRLVFATIILPGLMIFLMYNFIGDAIAGLYMPDEDYVPAIYAENLPESVVAATSASASFSAVSPASALEFIPLDSSEIPEIKARIQEKDADVLIVFPANFDQLVAEYDIASGGVAPNIEVYYNSSDTNSANTYQRIIYFLDGYESSLSNKFDVNNNGEGVTTDMATEKDSSSMFISSMMPMLMMIFLFSGCMAVAPESIAGEKERGTIATLLITPVKRSELAVGKIIALSAIALLSGASSFIGSFLSLPKMMGGGGMITTDIYSLADFFLLFAVILSTVLILIGVISIVSALAKSVKEASTFVMPLMVVSMLIGISGMFSKTASLSPAVYLIPLYNSVQCMLGVLSFSYAPVNMIITLCVNVVYAGIFVFILTRMFNSERIIFSK